VRYQFDVQAAKKAICRFNRAPSFVATDCVLDKFFPIKGRPTHASEIAVYVVLIDGLWATQLYRDKGAADKIAKALVDNWPSLAREPRRLKPDDLERRPQQVYQAAKPLLDVVFNRTRTRTKHYSFATKFLHWMTRVHFPPVDRNARIAINWFQGQQACPRALRINKCQPHADGYVAEYEKWIIFYYDLLNSIDRTDRKILLDVDRSSQPDQVRVGNSILRVLDKVFFILGKDINNRELTVNRRKK